jgi:hypothetical protein
VALRRRADIRFRTRGTGHATHQRIKKDFHQRAGDNAKDELMRAAVAVWCRHTAMSGIVSGTNFIGMILLTVAMPQSAQAMSRDTAVSAGSFFAAAMQCETQNLISPGQTSSLIDALKPFLSPPDQHNMQAGYARGEKESTVYVVQQKRWAAFAPDSASCYRVQGVLDNYKAQLDAD